MAPVVTAGIATHCRAEQVDLAGHAPGPVTGLQRGSADGPWMSAAALRRLPVMIGALFGMLMPVARS